MVGRLFVLFAPAMLLLSGDSVTTDKVATENSGTPAIVFDSMGGSGGGLVVNATDGWEFSVEKPLTVTSLGVWDHKLDGLGTEIPVGLWDSHGELLATATVPAGAAAKDVDGFRYVPIDPVALKSGQNYVIGAAYTPNTKENIAGGNSSAKFLSDGSIRWVKRRRVIRQPGLAFPQPKPETRSAVVNPGGFGPNFLIADATTPRIYYRTHKVAEPHDYVMVKLPEKANGSHSRDLVIFVSLFAKKSGEVTQILVNGEPLGTGPNALKLVASAVSELAADVTRMAGVRPNVRIAAPSWVRYADLVKVVDACSGRVNSRVYRTRPLKVELSTTRDTGIPLVNGDVKGRFMEKGDCVEDTWTGLLWQKDGSTSGRKNFQQAADYAATLELNGLTGWRVPTIEECASVFPADDSPFVGTGYTPEKCCAPPQEYISYWTSELDNRREDYAFVYHWYNRGGANNCYASRNFVRVRCVRDAPADSDATETLAQATLVKLAPKAQRPPSGIAPSEAGSPPRRSSHDGSQRGQLVEFLRHNVIGRTLAGRVTTSLDNGRLESVFERRTTFARLLVSANGFGFDEDIQIKETIRPRGKSKNESTPTRRNNRRVILRHQFSVRKSTGEVVGYIREIAGNAGQLSAAAVVKRAVVEIHDGVMIIRTTTVGYDDHITAAGMSPGAVKAQSQYSVHAGRLQRSQANEFFAVNADTLGRKSNRRETELIVDTELR